MKKFLVTIAGFGALLLLMCTIIEVALLFRPNIYAYKRQYMDEHLKDIKVLLLGSSHIEEAVKPELVGKGVFNLAISARIKDYDVALADIYVPKMDSLEAIVMPIDYTNFFFERQHENPLTKSIPEDLSGTCRCMHTKYMGTRIDPFWDIKDRPAEWELLAIPAVIDSTLAIDQKAYDETWKVYDDLAQITSRHHIRLILVMPPVYKTYQESIDPIVLNDIYQFVGKLQEKYPAIEFHENLFDKRFTSDDFQDSSHLNEQGAIKYSKLLSEIIYPHK